MEPSESEELVIRGEPERAPNTRDTGSGFICIYIYIYIYIFVCLWGDYFHEQGVKLRIANVGNGRQARVRTTLKVQSSLHSETGTVSCWFIVVETMRQPPSKISLLID